jgi:hypothetical protein
MHHVAGVVLFYVYIFTGLKRMNDNPPEPGSAGGAFPLALRWGSAMNGCVDLPSSHALASLFVARPHSVTPLPAVTADRILQDIKAARHKLGDLISDHKCNCEGDVAKAMEKAGAEGACAVVVRRQWRAALGAATTGVCRSARLTPSLLSVLPLLLSTPLRLLPQTPMRTWM